MQELIEIHLSRIYWTSAHMTERISEISDNKDFEKLKTEFNNMIELTEQQMLLSRQFLHFFRPESCIHHPLNLISFLEEVFSNIQHNYEDSRLRHITLNYYFKLITEIQLLSIEVLELISKKYPDCPNSQKLKEYFSILKPIRPEMAKLTILIERKN